jgi:Ca2+-binding EF-hand superfamily protein
MSISSIAGGQSVSQLMRTSFKPPSFETLDANADSSLTLDEIKLKATKGAASAESNARAEALFKAMDGDGDGSVTSTEKDSFDTQMAEQRQGMAFMTQQMASPSNADIFAATDTDGDGGVSLAELGDDDAASDVSSEALKKIFDLIDADGSGSITETESSEFLSAIKTALDEQRPADGPPPNVGPPPGGRPPGGPPPASASTETDEEEDTTVTLFSMAQSAYKTTQQQTLLEQLASIFDSAARSPQGRQRPCLVT